MLRLTHAAALNVLRDAASELPPEAAFELALAHAGDGREPLQRDAGGAVVGDVADRVLQALGVLRRQGTLPLTAPLLPRVNGQRDGLRDLGLVKEVRRRALAPVALDLEHQSGRGGEIRGLIHAPKGGGEGQGQIRVLPLQKLLIIGRKDLNPHRVDGDALVDERPVPPLSAHDGLDVPGGEPAVGVQLLAGDGVVAQDTGGRMELLNCVMMAVCSFLLTEGLEQAGAQSSLLRVVDTCVDQADAILSLPTMDLSGAELTPERHDLRAEDIRFSYGEKQIVNGITLDIPERTTTAIVGPSGGGKTTLCHLLSRFWDVDGGRVTLGGHDVREYDMDSLMRNFSFVFQNVYLFHDTVANNIRFGQPDAPMEAVVAAAKKARCHDFIMKLPQGYDTVIGEAGGSLSGGERQRLSIARAMMKDAPIIILDEATANVDPENEKELMEAVNELTHEKTVIMIAHRLKTVRRADQILVVDRGRIVQRGTHGELMAQEGIYRRFITGRERAVSWKL